MKGGGEFGVKMDLGVSKNRGVSPEIIHVHKVFHYKPSILEGFPPIFGNIHSTLEVRGLLCWSHQFQRIMLGYPSLSLRECFLQIFLHGVIDFHENCSGKIIPYLHGSK